MVKIITNWIWTTAIIKLVKISKIRLDKLDNLILASTAEVNMATVCVLEARINAAYHIISRHIMLINVGQCCLYQMYSYLSGQCGGTVWGWKLHCILQICLKLGFFRIYGGALNLFLRCSHSKINFFTYPWPVCNSLIFIWDAKLHQTSPCHKNDDSTMAPPASFCFGIVYQGGKCGSQTSRLQIVSVLALWSNPLLTSDLKLRFAGFRSSFPSFALCSWH